MKEIVMKVKNHGFNKMNCPLCNEMIKGVPALSRIDNKTKICSKCGILQALEDFIKYKKEKKNVF